jgi:hypothetical protein
MICTLVKPDGSARPAISNGTVHPSLLRDISSLSCYEREVIRAIVDIMLSSKIPPVT